MQLSREQLLRAYRQMKTIREFEDRLHEEIPKGLIPGFTHLYSGQEAIAVGVCENLNDSDAITSTHRGHGHCIAKGCDVKGMMAEIYGRATGLCGGKGGSMHIADLSKGMLGANGIVGGGPPLAMGASIAFRNRGKKEVAVALAGDGSCNSGPVFEAMNMAVMMSLPVIFVFENNGYSEQTAPAYAVGGGKTDMVRRAEGFGMPAFRADGTDFFAVHEMFGEAAERARNGEGPTALEFNCLRYFGHFEGDPQRYRAKGEVQMARDKMDCLKIFRAKVTEAALLDAADLDAIDAEVLALIDEAVEEAIAAPFPDPSGVPKDVYIAY
ncbi:MAG: thiamine pyrophosphate-dependent dehydrogenase E1 component subunit alpha [Proteobacteria bacterium]|nr:thiamine pyrophosphate-dependent dehydrogenase E1 component subunit alpha [Pseudomonadota bacterium]